MYLAWQIPHEGTLEFDYVSTTRPPHGTKAMDDAVFESIMASLPTRLEHSGDAETRSSSAQRLPTGGSLSRGARIIELFDEHAKVEALVSLFSRVLDVENWEDYITRKLSFGSGTRVR